MDDVGRTPIWWHGLIILAAAAVVMGFLTACGNAVLRLSESKTAKLAEKSRRWRRIQKLQQKPELIIQTNLAARTLILFAMGAAAKHYFYYPLKNALGGTLTGKSLSIAAAVISLIIAAAAAAVTAAVSVDFPKRLCVSGRAGEGFVRASFWLYRVLMALMKPAQLIVAGVTALLSAIFGVKKEDLSEQVTGEEILQMLDAANEKGGIKDDQAEMISNIFEFPDLEVCEVMTHRREISAVEKTLPVAEAVRISVETGVSRIPVFNETIDDICGVLYVKDLLPLILDPANKNAPAADYMHKIKFVPETSKCGELFTYFNKNHKQIAVVLDEYGGTLGIVTMEDLLECIVGNIRDEYDENEAEDIEEITPNTFDIQGTADPEDVMEKLGCPFEEETDFSTMGGFVTDLLGYIPADGETPAVRYKNLTLCVIKAKDNRIEKIRAVKDKRRETPIDDE